MALGLLPQSRHRRRLRAGLPAPAAVLRPAAECERIQSAARIRCPRIDIASPAARVRDRGHQFRRDTVRVGQQSDHRFIRRCRDTAACFCGAAEARRAHEFEQSPVSFAVCEDERAYATCCSYGREQRGDVRADVLSSAVFPVHQGSEPARVWGYAVTAYHLDYGYYHA